MKVRSAPEIHSRLINSEILLGYSIAPHWLDDEWIDSIVSEGRGFVRLVALHAKEPGKGAFTRLIRKIEARGYIPVLVEPNQLLKDWCDRHNFRRKHIGRGELRHEVWFPRRNNATSNR
jgi:hypothetical protein